MKHFFLIATALLLVFHCDNAGAEQGSAYLDSIKYPPIRTSIPKPEKVVLQNGMTLLLLPDHELPLFSVSASIKAGAIWDPAEKTGLSALAGVVIREGGTTTRPPDEVDLSLESMAGSVEVSIGEDRASAQLSVLSSDIEKGVSIFADILRNPRFDNNRLELARGQMIDAIKREQDSPTSLAGSELAQIISAPSPYSRKATQKSVSNITRQDLIDLHKTYFVPGNITLGITGDFDEFEITKIIEKYFGDWQGSRPGFSPAPRSAKKSRREFFIIDKKLKQSVIRGGHVGIKRMNPDYFAVRVMDKILGSNGFSSRLLQAIRVSRGLAYSAWSYNLGGRWDDGFFLIGAETKTESTGEVVSLMLGEIKKIRSVAVSREELDVAKNSIINSFVFIFDTPQRAMGEWMTLAYYGMPDTFLTNYTKNVETVTVDDVLRVAKEYLDPDGLTFVIAGEKNLIEKNLKKFGKTSLLKPIGSEN